MAVYQRRYSSFSGERTSNVTRFLVLPKFIIKDLFKSRLLVGFYALCFAVPLFFASIIYIRHNVELLAQLQIDIADVLTIDAGFFGLFLGIQARYAFFLALFVGPGLVSRDLFNNALPLYLSRPISRWDYILGKSVILFGLLSSVTWLPALVLFVLQSNLAGWSWGVDHARILLGSIGASLLLIVFLTTLALALSAWVKWKMVAGLLFIMTFLSGSLFGNMASILLRSDLGFLASPSRLLAIVSSSWIGDSAPAGPSAGVSLLVLVAATAFCTWLLHRKVQAYEVIR